MLLWIVYGLLNQFLKIHGIQFNPATIVWLQEALKLVISLLLFFLQNGGPHEFWRQATEHWVMLCWYMIPAGLYALTDVLTYINLRSFDPVTYYLLGEMKLVVTAMVHQVLFHRRLNFWHWVAVAIITMGCTLKTIDSLEGAAAVTHSQPQNSSPTLINYMILLLQILASTVAGVYNEKLLKDKPAIPINLQNMCLYLDGILLLTLGFIAGLSKQSIRDALMPSHVAVLQPAILAMACTMSVAGLVTSRFLKLFDSVRKSMATALVVVALPLMSWLLFGTRVTFQMVLSIASVVGGMYIYSRQPSPGTVPNEAHQQHGPTGHVVGGEGDHGENEAEELLPVS
jgi:drug/metabolite transporter (DMT)-like permease